MLVSAAEGHSVRVFHDAHTSSFVREGYGVKLWDSVSGTLLHRLPGRAAVFLRDGHHLVTGYDHSVWICDAQSGVARLVYERGPGGFVRTLAAGSGDAVAVGFTDGCLRVLHAQTGDVLAEAISKLGRPGDVTAAAFSLDGTLLVSAHSEGFPEATTIRIWNPVNMQMVSSIDCPVASIWGLAPSPDGKRIAAASDDGFVRFWRIGSPVSGRQLRGFPLMGGADKLLFSHDGNRLAILDAYGNIRVFNGRTGEFLWSEHAAHRDGAYTIWFASSGELVCDSGSPGSERVWSMETGADLDRVQTTSGGGLQQQFQFRGPANRETKYRYVASAGEGRIENTIGGEAVAWYPVPFSEFDASPTGLEWAGISGNQLHVVRLNGPDV
jgi:WD40 repeat protein